MNDKYKGLLRVGSWIPVMILNGIVVFCYIIYMGTYLVPLLFGGYAYQHHSVESIFSEVIEFDERITNLLAADTQLAVKRKGLMLFFILHSLALLLYYGLVQTMTTEPGRVPKSWKDDIQKEIDQYLIQEDLMISRWKDDKRASKSINRLPDLLPFNQIEIKSTPFHEQDDSEVNYDDQVDIDREIQFDDDFKLQLNIKAKIELLDKPGRRFCKRCLVMKPPRTHHCRQCQICWLKMDHHCQFVNNCIGFGNYKYFLNLILFSSVLLIFMISTYTRTFVYMINDPEVSDFLMVTVVLYYLFSWLLCIALMGFFLFHMRLVIISQTTLEFMEDKKDALGGGYNHGVLKNIQAVLGNNCLIWFLPIVPNYDGSGTKF